MVSDSSFELLSPKAGDSCFELLLPKVGDGSFELLSQKGLEVLSPKRRR